MIKKYFLLSVGLILSLSACANVELGSHIAKSMINSNDSGDNVGHFKVGNPYRIKGKTYTPYEKYHYSETGIASWYGPGFHGKMTANGEIFNKYELTAAHRTLQMPAIVRVTNLDNGRSIIVRVNDRGPFSHNRIIDLSEKAAEIIGMKKVGTARVRVDVMEEASRQVGSAAKRGLSTKGTEIAFNKGQRLNDNMRMAVALPKAKPGYGRRPIATAPPRYAANSVVNQRPTPPIMQNNQFQNVLFSQAQAKPMAKPIVNKGNLYVNVGEFIHEDEAFTLSNALYTIKEPVEIHREVAGDTPIYNVRIGPIQSQSRANDIVSNFKNQGRVAQVVSLK